MFFTFCLAGAASAAVFFVNTVNDTADINPGDGNCVDAGANCSLRAAISEANALAGADTINVPQGNYIQSLAAANEDANAGGDWDVSGDLTITSTGPGLTSFLAAFTPGTATERVLDVRSGTVTVNQIAFMNGRFDGAMTAATRGAGIENLGALTLNLCFVNSNQINSTGGSAFGAGIYNAGASLTLNNTQVTGNTGARTGSGSLIGGGIYHTGGPLSLTGSTVGFNTLTGSNPVGGGIGVSGPSTITITGTSVSGNTLTGTGTTLGGGMYVTFATTVNIFDSHFDGNTAGTAGLGNAALGTGVAVLAYQGTMVFNATNTTFSNNRTTPFCLGGGLFLDTLNIGTPNQINSRLDKVTVDNNAGICSGIGMNAFIDGGPIQLDVLNSVFSRNHSNDLDGTGGGMHFGTSGNPQPAAAGTLNISNSTISDNTVHFTGGGAYFNTASGRPVEVNLNFVTIAGNSANMCCGGGIFNDGGINLNVKNSIIADNTAPSGPDVSGNINAIDFDHIENTAGTIFVGNNSRNTTGFDPQLGPLQNNGGATQTRMLAVASPLVNVIPNGFGDCGTTFTTDQRGLPRPALSRCDIGAAELQSFPGGPFTVSGTVMTEGGMPIRNIVVVLSEGGLAQPRFTVTGSLGNYIFTDVPASGYTVSLSSKRFVFAEDGKFVNVFDNLGNVNFVGTAATTRFGNFEMALPVKNSKR